MKKVLLACIAVAALVGITLLIAQSPSKKEAKNEGNVELLADSQGETNCTGDCTDCNETCDGDENSEKHADCNKNESCQSKGEDCKGECDDCKGDCKKECDKEKHDCDKESSCDKHTEGGQAKKEACSGGGCHKK